MYKNTNRTGRRVRHFEYKHTRQQRQLTTHSFHGTRKWRRNNKVIHRESKKKIQDKTEEEENLFLFFK